MRSLGLGEGAAFVDAFAGALQQVETGVALVAVPVDRIDAHRAQRAHAADAEDLLLAQAVLLVAAVEAGGDGARPVGVPLDVGVEQEERDAADLDAARSARRTGSCGLSRTISTHQRLAVRVVDAGRRLGARFELRRDVELPAVVGQPLPEVALAVEEGDADERQAEIAG